MHQERLIANPVFGTFGAFGVRRGIGLETRFFGVFNVFELSFEIRLESMSTVVEDALNMFLR